MDLIPSPRDRPRSHPGELLIAAALPFEGQRWYHHLLLFVGGIALWTGAYVAAMYVSGSVHIAGSDTPEAVDARQQAATIALVVTSIYFMGFWYRGYGSFFLSILYPGLILVLLPDTVFALFGTLEGNPITSTSGLFPNRLQFRREALGVAAPYIIIAVLL